MATGCVVESGSRPHSWTRRQYSVEEQGKGMRYSKRYSWPCRRSPGTVCYSHVLKFSEGMYGDRGYRIDRYRTIL